jgi:tripartite-type tricarboxylate transporter receptor subunit TctC
MKSKLRTAGYVLTVASAMLGLHVTTSSAQAPGFPNRAITFVVPFNPGGGTDPIGRQYAGQLSKILGVDVNVINKPGGSGAIGTAAVVTSKPDGYTIGITTNSALTYQPLENDGLAWKTPADYQPIVKLDDLPAYLAVRADAPWNSFEDFIADVKKNPGKIRLSTAGVGTLVDLIVQQMNKESGLKIVTVPLTGGSGEAMLSLLGGRVEGYIGYGAAIAGQRAAGKVKVLAGFQPGKSEDFPEAVSVVDLGYRVTLNTGNYVIAPKGLPADVLQKLDKASQEVVRSPEFLKFLRSQGFLSDPKGPEETRAELVQYQKDFADLVAYLQKTN